MTIYSATAQLTPVPPFDFAKSLDFLGLFAPTRNEQALASDTPILTKAVRVVGQTIVFQLTPAGDIEAPALACMLFSDQPIEESIRLAALDRVTFFLSLNDDLRPFYALGQADPAFAPIVARFYGYHQVKFITPFENACWAVLTQRNPMQSAKKAKQGLVERFGGALDLDGTRYLAFPEPARVAAAGLDELLELAGNERRASYLHAIATAFDGVDEVWLRTAPYAEVEAWLREIKGIGAWSATFVLLRGLGRMEKAPSGEGEFAAAVAKVYGPAGPAEIERFAAHYGAWRGYWAHYLRIAA